MAYYGLPDDGESAMEQRETMKAALGVNAETATRDGTLQTEFVHVGGQKEGASLQRRTQKQRLPPR